MSPVGDATSSDIALLYRRAGFGLRSEEIDGLKKQLETQQRMLNDEARGKLVTLIESKQKNLDRATQDAQKISRASGAN